MATCGESGASAPRNDPCSDPTVGQVIAALGLALAFVALTRLPVARPEAFDFDELGYLETVRVFTFPMHHTLFLASGARLGWLLGDVYQGFVVLDMLVSALALVSVWWWLRALVRPATALMATLLLGVAPVFWAYGAMAANYTAIPLVGAFLLGVVHRGVRAPRPWHPVAAAVVLAIGCGYRQDIGTFWLPLFLLLLWRHRGMAAVLAGLLFAALNLSWMAAMLHDVGGWASYRAASAEFAYRAGYLNSVWYLGLIDAPLRYAVKATMALLWTFGPGLLFVPRGLIRLSRRPGGGWVIGLLLLSVTPAVISHLSVHFGMPGYAFHYVPALLGLVALGIGRCAEESREARRPVLVAVTDDRAPRRLGLLATMMAGLFLFYPTDYRSPGFRGSFDLAFARHTRVGLRTRPPLRDPEHWRTINSQELPEGGRRAQARRTSFAEIWSR